MYGGAGLSNGVGLYYIYGGAALSNRVGPY